MTVRTLRIIGKPLKYGFGRGIRLAEKEGQHGNFYSLEIYETISDGDGHTKEVPKGCFTITVLNCVD